MAPIDHMLEAVADDTAVGAMRRAASHSLPPGTPCPNCATPLEGAWCHACGQRAEKYDRSILALIGEALEGLTHLDSRVWRTLPRLVLKPGGLTRDYLDGHRAAQIPPFRLFLVVLLLVFFAGSWNFQANHVNFKFAPQKSFVVVDPGDREAFARAGDAMAAKGGGPRWLVTRAAAAMKNPEAMTRAMEEWSHQFAILMLPVAALLLSVLFAFKKRVYVFDHLIFSMHSLSFVGLLFTTAFLAGIWIGGWAWSLLLLAPLHLYVHMRGTYGTSWYGTLIRMFLLWCGSVTGFALLMAGLLFVGLATLR